MRTDETRAVENLLGKHFDRADAYRYNSASIRVRVIDSRFNGVSDEERDTRVEAVLSQLPADTRADIINLFLYSPDELSQPRNALDLLEFEDPSPSRL